MIDSQKSFKVVSLFSYQGSLCAVLSSDNFYMIPKSSAFVKHFFHFLKKIYPHRSLQNQLLFAVRVV